jgi:NADH-quinone oxidoreductase subunit N
VPPLVGFWAKLRIFQALWETDHLWLVIIAATMSVVGAFYYLRVVWFICFDEPTGPPLPKVPGAAGVRLALGINAAAALALGAFPAALLNLCARLIH